MYVPHPRNRLTPFYAVYIQQQWRLNPESLTHIAQICSTYSTEQPIDLRLGTVEQYVQEQIALNQDLTNLVVTELYQKLSIVGGFGQSEAEVAVPAENRNRQIWINFIHYISEKVIANTLNRLPEHKQVESILDLLRTAKLVEPEKLFNGFDPSRDRDLLTGIERWTYRCLRNSIFSQIRKREQFFGLRDLGVVSKSTRRSICKALSSQILHSAEGLCNHNLKDRQIVDLLLVDIYKNYLKRAQVRTDKLVDRDWQQIEREVQNQWSNLELDLPPPSISVIQAELKLIGSYIRKAASISTSSLDTGIIAHPGIKRKNIDRAGEADWCNVHNQLFEIIKQTVLMLEPSCVEILEFRYRNGLTQAEIGLKIDRDQSIISKRLLAIEKIILRNIYKQLSHPDDVEVKKIDRTAIQAMKQALRAFYRNQQI